MSNGFNIQIAAILAGLSDDGDPGKAERWINKRRKKLLGVDLRSLSKAELAEKYRRFLALDYARRLEAMDFYGLAEEMVSPTDIGHRPNKYDDDE